MRIGQALYPRRQDLHMDGYAKREVNLEPHHARGDCI